MLTVVVLFWCPAETDPGEGIEHVITAAATTSLHPWETPPQEWAPLRPEVLRIALTGVAEHPHETTGET